jgi:hypothetical protein
MLKKVSEIEAGDLFFSDGIGYLRLDGPASKSGGQKEYWAVNWQTGGLAFSSLRLNALVEICHPLGSGDDKKLIENWPIAKIKLPARIKHVLLTKGVTRLKDLKKISAQQLLSYRNFGHRSLVTLNDFLRPYGLSLKGEQSTLF